MAFTFLKAEGFSVGTSLLQEDLVPTVREIMEQARRDGVEILLPVDVVIAPEFSADAPTRVVSVGEIPPDWMGLDIGPDTARAYAAALADARTRTATCRAIEPCYLVRIQGTVFRQLEIENSPEGRAFRRGLIDALSVQLRLANEHLLTLDSADWAPMARRKRFFGTLPVDRLRVLPPRCPPPWDPGFLVLWDGATTVMMRSHREPGEILASA
jgi:hypothetical protein